MNTQHATDINAKCPHGDNDYYRATFYVGERFIAVEDIDRVIKSLTVEPIFQEDLTGKLAEQIGCRVVTEGRHGDFHTTCDSGERG